MRGRRKEIAAALLTRTALARQGEDVVRSSLEALWKLYATRTSERRIWSCATHMSWTCSSHGYSLRNKDCCPIPSPKIRSTIPAPALSGDTLLDACQLVGSNQRNWLTHVTMGNIKSCK